MKQTIKKIVTKLSKRFTHKKIKDNGIQELINNKEFMKKLLEFSSNDIDVFCTYLGDIFVYYVLSNDNKLDYSIEDILNKRVEIELYSPEEIKEKGFFTHSCNGSIIEQIKKNGLGSQLNTNEKLYTALSNLEKKLKITGEYTKQQSGRKDEVYFTSAGATTFGYACNFAPERLFLGILRQEYENNIPVKVGENKKDYYRKVIYKKFGENISQDIRNDIETVLDGYFSDSNYVISFKVNDVISSDNIFWEVVEENNRINLDEYIQNNCSMGNFFTSHIGSNSNPNNMDNLVMINTILSPEKLRLLKVPDRYDLIQLIALNKNLQQGEKIDFFTFKKVEEKENISSLNLKTLSTTQELDAQFSEELTETADKTKKNRLFSFISNILNKIKDTVKKEDVKMLPEAYKMFKEEQQDSRKAFLEGLTILPEELREIPKMQEKTDNAQLKQDKKEGFSVED